MITILKLAQGRKITLHTSENIPRRTGGIKLETRRTSFYFDLSPREQARLAYALTDHRLRKQDEIKEIQA